MLEHIWCGNLYHIEFLLNYGGIGLGLEHMRIAEPTGRDLHV